MAKYRQDRAEEIKLYKQGWKQRLKEEAFARYGTQCAECGFDNPLALCIDHIEDNGAEERLRVGGVRTFAGWNFYSWLKKQGWPEGYQTLCANCNMIKQQLRWAVVLD